MVEKETQTVKLSPAAQREWRLQFWEVATHTEVAFLVLGCFYTILTPCKQPIVLLVPPQKCIGLANWTLVEPWLWSVLALSLGWRDMYCVSPGKVCEKTATLDGQKEQSGQASPGQARKQPCLPQGWDRDTQSPSFSPFSPQAALSCDVYHGNGKQTRTMFKQCFCSKYKELILVLALLIFS